ncbi:MAG TPA: LLM class flavin-dependent oxidoreductase [Baekduia sp.]|uniref:LLM class flavin-dependent oxidoreductase n=1 Tax=Baekduia sp. TaxID=2600305 RepID=UPI002B814F3D|nr:LLM class flavin-dependent oxidoreductase [Baekduia sp.]HMJ32600.1 LLM class flavin-dependent oxidoreductase [Baekduia sp.]
MPDRKPRVAIQLPEVEREVRWPEYRAMAIAGEEVGFDGLYVGDHLLYRGDGRPERGPWDAWTLLAALAAVTDRVVLGPLVACAAFHPPAVLAKMAATLSEISGGRFVLGLGSGWNEDEFRAFGIPFDRRVARFAEAFTIVGRLLRGERVTLDGEFHSVQDAVLLPPARHRTRLMIGSNGPRMLRIALPHVDAWNTWYEDYGNTAEGFSALNATIDAAVIEAGRAPEDVARSACAFVVLDGASGERPITSAARPIEGSSNQIAARIRELADAGADEVILVASPITERSIRTLGEALALV